MRVSNAYIYHFETLQIGTLLNLYMPQVTVGMLPSHQVGLQDQLLNIVVEKAAQCHGVMGYFARFKSC